MPTSSPSTDDRRARAADPENRLLWRTNRRRLDAECIRDTILAVSGQLEHDDGGPELSRRTSPRITAYQQSGTRRSVYSPVFRNALPELFEAFDFADPSMVVGRRNVSTVAPQALYLMNHPFILEQSRHAARRLLSETEPGRRRPSDRACLPARAGPAAERARAPDRDRVPGTGPRMPATVPRPVPRTPGRSLFQALFATDRFSLC